MPIEAQYRDGGRMLVTVLTGTVTDQDLYRHYASLLSGAIPGGQCELVDGRGVGELAISADGLAAFGKLLWEHVDRIPRGRPCAMLAGSDLVYRLFQVWEAEKGVLPYPLAVFRNEVDALCWLKGATVAEAG